jgi:Hypothetical protein (DUF2513)
MKRDLELVRKLMLAIESEDTNLMEIEGYDSSQINYHLELMIEAKLVEGRVTRQAFNRFNITIEKLSWDGCYFLDEARDESVWKKKVEILQEKSGSLSFTLLTQILVSAAKQHFGLG